MQGWKLLQMNLNKQLLWYFCLEKLVNTVFVCWLTVSCVLEGLGVRVNGCVALK